MNNPSSIEARGEPALTSRGRIRAQQEQHDLQSQLEDLRLQVWACEADWRLDDRIDMALKAWGPK